VIRCFVLCTFLFCLVCGVFACVGDFDCVGVCECLCGHVYRCFCGCMCVVGFTQQQLTVYCFVVGIVFVDRHIVLLMKFICFLSGIFELFHGGGL